MIAWLTLLFAAQAADPQPTRVTANIVVAVAQREASAEALVSRAEELGGYFQSRNDLGLSLRVPSEHVDALIASAEAEGRVLGRSVERADVGQEIADLAGRLAARREVLGKYFELLRTAGADAIVTVEQQIVSAIDEIERIEGRLRLLRDQAAYGRVSVDFRFRERSAPVTNGETPFDWIDSLNLQDMIAGHTEDRPDWRSRGATLDEPPEGFSAWKRDRRYRAASPDNVMFRIRAVKHDPRADLAFWAEAVENRMVDAGYRVIDQGLVTASKTEGAMLELAAPLDNEDWSYLVAIFPRGRRIVIVEAAGEVSAFATHRDAVLDAVERVEP